MGSHRILELTDSVLVAYIIGNGAGTSLDVFPGKNTAEKTLPNTVCESTQWSESDGMEFTGNFVLTTVVTVNTKAFLDVPGTPIDDSGARIASTFDLFQETDPASLGSIITTYARANSIVMTCIAARVTGGDRSFADGSWHDSISLELICCPSELT